MGLTLWIAIYVKHLQDCLVYVDNVLMYELKVNLVWYVPFQKPLPTEQMCLLQLWDKLRIPYDKPKQVYSSIIGFDVSPNAMTITMPLQC